MKKVNMDFLKDYSRTKAEEFVQSLQGRYNAYVSDKFIIAFLVDNFYKQYFELRLHGVEDTNISLTNVAYNSSIYLFETLLEGGCGVIMNGHNAAQNFSMLFTENFTEEDFK